MEYNAAMPRRYRPREVIRVLQRLGWVIVRQRGSHVRLRKPDGGSPVSVSLSDPLVDRGTFSSIARQCGMTGPQLTALMEEYL